MTVSCDGSVWLPLVELVMRRETADVCVCSIERSGVETWRL